MGEVPVACVYEFHPFLDPLGQLLLYNETLLLNGFEWKGPCVVFWDVERNICRQSRHDHWEAAGWGSKDCWPVSG